MDEAARRTHIQRVRQDGYTIVEDAIEPELIEALSVTLARLERELDANPAMNGFEGHRTVRIYNLLARDPVFGAYRCTARCCRSSRACSTPVA